MTFDEQTFPFGLGSDNHSGIHPQILSAIARVNIGWTPSYGTDPVSEHAIAVFRKHFGQNTSVHFCFNGTAANVLSFAPLVKPYQSILASEHAHINVDECSAPERLLGVKIVPIPNRDGKIEPKMLEPHLIRRGDQHFTQVNAVSISQPTELGTLYTRAEIDRLSEFCKGNDLWLHIDGARYANAAVKLQLSFSELSAGADVISFGGTKNGLMFGEAVLFMSPKAQDAAKEFRFIRKQLMQLPSKTRFIAAQFAEYLDTPIGSAPLWSAIAKNSCDRAAQLAAGLKEHRIEITQAVESNAVFCVLERPRLNRLRDCAFFYVWNERSNECRLMTTWSTTENQILNFLRTI